MANVRSRLFAKKDGEELNALYNLVAGRSRNIEQFTWEWLAPPEGQGSMWLIEDSDSGKIVGHHGLIPIKLSYFGESILTGKTENTVMHPQYRGKGIYTPFEAKFLEEAKDRFRATWTTAGAVEQGRVRLKLGYSPVAEYVTYSRIVRKSYLDAIAGKAISRRIRNRALAGSAAFLFKLGSSLPYLLTAVFRKKGSVDKGIGLSRIGDIAPLAGELDRFWERNRGKFGITVDRNSRFLKWRIFDNPNVSYDFLIARKGETVAGYAVTQKTADGEGLIVDIVADNNDKAIFDSILEGAVRSLRGAGAGVVQFRTLPSGNFLNESMKRNGFAVLSLPKFLGGGAAAESSPLMAKSLDDRFPQDKMADPANWYFTPILFEGIS